MNRRFSKENTSFKTSKYKIYVMKYLPKIAHNPCAKVLKVLNFHQACMQAQGHELIENEEQTPKKKNLRKFNVIQSILINLCRMKRL